MTDPKFSDKQKHQQNDAKNQKNNIDVKIKSIKRNIQENSKYKKYSPYDFLKPTQEQKEKTTDKISNYKPSKKFILKNNKYVEVKNNETDNTASIKHKKPNDELEKRYKETESIIMPPEEIKASSNINTKNKDELEKRYKETESIILPSENEINPSKISLNYSQNSKDSQNNRFDEDFNKTNDTSNNIRKSNDTMKNSLFTITSKSGSQKASNYTINDKNKDIINGVLKKLETNSKPIPKELEEKWNKMDIRELELEHLKNKQNRIDKMLKHPLQLKLGEYSNLKQEKIKNDRKIIELSEELINSLKNRKLIINKKLNNPLARIFGKNIVSLKKEDLEKEKNKITQEIYKLENILKTKEQQKKIAPTKASANKIIFENAKNQLKVKKPINFTKNTNIKWQNKQPPKNKP